MRQILISLSGLVTLTSLFGQDISGSWKGDLEFSGRTMDIVVTFQKTGEVWSGTLSSQKQQLKDIAISNILITNSELTFDVPLAGGKWAGRIASDSLKGNWIQGPFKAQLNFGRLKEKPVINTTQRRQTPTAPFPYTEEEVYYQNAKDQTHLAATLTIPKGEGQFPAAILLTVAGANDRDQTHGNPPHKPFKVLADYLSRNGIAVLRTDDRGVGGSNGDLFNSTYEDFARDAIAGFELLKEHSKIDPTKIGFIGNSEGTLVGPMAASMNQEAAFIITLGGIGIPGDQVILDQIGGLGALSGFDDPTIERYHEGTKDMLEMIKSGMDSADFANRLTTQLKSQKNDNNNTQLFLLPQSIEKQVKIFSSPWYRYQVNYNPSAVLRKTKIPFLAIHGDLDPFVIPDKNLQAIGAHLSAAGNPHYSLVKIKGLNHIMQDAESGSPAAYTLNESSFSERVLKMIGSWLEITLGKLTTEKN